MYVWEDKRQTQLKSVDSLDSFVHINRVHYKSSAQKVICLIYDNLGEYSDYGLLGCDNVWFDR